MSRSVTAIFAASAALVIYQVAGFASGSSMPSATSKPMTNEERAVESYHNGEEHRTKGRKLEDEAATKDARDAEKTLAKARGEFEKALKDYMTASKLNPSLFQAYNGLGYSYRKTGDYPKALEMYEKAISMAPGYYSEAVEYRAEAYLALNRVDEAKKEYLDLFGADRPQADLLMAAMTKWVAQRKTDPAGVDPATVAAFETWIGERASIAKDVALMGITTDHSRW